MCLGAVVLLAVLVVFPAASLTDRDAPVPPASPTERFTADSGNASWAGGPIASLVAGKNPLPPVLDPVNGKVYVVNYDVSNVTVLSATSGAVVGSLSTGTQPVEPGIDPVTGAIYLPVEGASTIAVYSGVDDGLIASIPVPQVQLPLTPTFDPRTGVFFVSSSLSTTIDVVAVASNTIVATVHLPGDPLIPTFVNSSDALYVPIEGTDNVSMISGSSLQLVDNFSVGSSYLQTPLFDPADGDLYFPELSGSGSNGMGEIGVVASATNSLVATVPVGRLPETPTLDPANGDLYVGNYGSDTVTVISGATNEVVATVPTGGAPGVPAFDAGNGDLYVTNAATNNVTVISGAGTQVIGTIPVGPDPEDAVYDPADSSILVANKGASNVTELTDGTVPVYAVSFSETGLPGGTPWTVSLNGVPLNSTAASVAIRFPDGVFAYSVRADAGCIAQHPTGSVAVDGAPVSVAVSFTSGACPGVFGLTPTGEVEAGAVVAATLVALATFFAVRSYRRRRWPDDLEREGQDEAAASDLGAATESGSAARYRSGVRKRQRRRYTLAGGVTAVAIAALLVSVPGFGPSPGGPGTALSGYEVDLGGAQLGVVACGNGTRAIAERIAWLNSSVPLTTGHVVITVVDVDGDTLWSSGAPPSVTAENACAGPLPISNFTGIAGVNVGFSWYVTLSDPGGAILAVYTISGGWTPVSGSWPAPIANGSALTFICNPSVSRLGAYGFEGPYRFRVGLIAGGGTEILGSTEL